MKVSEHGALGFSSRFTISERFGLPPGSMRSQPPGKFWNWLAGIFSWTGHEPAEPKRSNES